MVVFEKGKTHIQDTIIRICVIQDDKIKENDSKKGLTATLENAMAAVPSCYFGLWANGSSYHFLQKEDDAIGYDFDFTDLQNLGRGEAIIRIEQPQYDCSLDTFPLTETTEEQRQNNIESVIEIPYNGESNICFGKNHPSLVSFLSINIDRITLK